MAKNKDLYNIQLGQLITRNIKKRFKISLSEDYWYSNKINVYAVPNKDSEGGDTDIVVSPFPPSSWKNIYALKIVPKIAKDVPGFITEFTKILKTCGANILKLQSNPSFASEPYSFWLLLDLSKCEFLETIDEQLLLLADNPTDRFHFNSRKKSIQEYMQGLLLSLIDVIDVRGLQFLYNFVSRMEIEHGAYWREISITENVRFDIANYEGVLPKDVLNYCNIRRDKIQYAIISNPNQKTYFIIRVFGDIPVIYLDVQHADVVGAINNISTIISEHEGNVLSATVLIERAGNGMAHYFVLISIPSNNVKDMLIKLVKSTYTRKLVIYNYSDQLKSIDIPALKRYSKINLISQNAVRQKLIDIYKQFIDGNYFSTDVLARVFFEKLADILIFSVVIAFISPLLIKFLHFSIEQLSSLFNWVANSVLHIIEKSSAAPSK